MKTQEDLKQLTKQVKISESCHIKLWKYKNKYHFDTFDSAIMQLLINNEGKL